MVATQIPFHTTYNGVVPEIASRKHTEWIMPVVKQALSEANLTLEGIDGIAVTNRPGLMGSLLVGLTFAKTVITSYSIHYTKLYDGGAGIAHQALRGAAGRDSVITSYSIHYTKLYESLVSSRRISGPK